MQPTPLRVLYVEDEPDAVELLELELGRSGFAPSGERVQSRQEFLAHLHPKLDVILSDFTMPGFTGLEALRLLKESRISVPFIFVSGTIGEDIAVAAMQEGAADYLIKDRLARLGSAVKQAIERFRLEEEKLAIEHTTARLAAIVESSTDAIIAINLDGVIVNWNAAAEQLYGYPLVEIVGKQIAILVPSVRSVRRRSDAPEDSEDLARKYRSGEHVQAYETIRVRKDGRRVDISVSISPIRDSAGVVVGASFIAQNIGRRKRAERLLAAEQAVSYVLMQSRSLEEAGPGLLQAMAEALRWEVAVLWKVDSEANVLRRVHTYCASWADADFVATLDQRAVLEPEVGLAGRAWSRQEPVWDSTTTGQRERLRGAVSIPMRHGSRLVGAIEFYSPDFREPDAQMLAALDNITSQICQFSERRQGESALRTSEERYRTLVSATTAIVWISAASREFVTAQPGWTAFTGQTFDQLRGWGWLDAVHPEDRDRTAENWARAVEQRAVYQIVNRLRRADGEYRHMSGRAVPMLSLDGEIVEWVGVHVDVTDQLGAESDRDRLLLQLELQIERLPLAYLLAGPDLRFTRWNPAAEKMFGFTEAEVLGKTPLESIVPPQSRAIFGTIVARLKTGDMNAHGVCENVTRDGRTITCQWYNTPLMDSGGAFVGLLSLAEDITQRGQMEKQLRQAQKMDAIGQLAAGVAHDFNNLLTIINGYSDIMIRGFKPEDKNLRMVSEILHAGERAAGLTRQLLAFSRQQVLAPQVLNLNAVLADSEKMLRRLIGEDVELKTIKDPALANIKADPGQVEQVLLNLTVNARHAMPSGGKLTVTTQNVELNAEQLLGFPENKPGAYVLLTVSDNGCGMNKEVQAKIFEPFFTTKGTAGTGLGLATVFGIVQQSHGKIEVVSEPGRGAAFKIYLPRVSEPILIPKSHSTVPESLRGSETILLVEDDEPVRSLARFYLESNGYTVLEAANGDAAIRLFEKRRDTIDLLITDVVMPRMSGRELADQLVAKRPELRVLYFSGYTNDAVLRHGVSHDQAHFLQKPFSPLKLALKVRETLNSR